MALDLLQRPAQARRRRLFRRLAWMVAMGSLGAGLCWAGVQTLLEDVPQLQLHLAQAQQLGQQQTRDQQALQSVRQQLQQMTTLQSAHEQLQRTQRGDMQVLQVVSDLLSQGVVLDRLVFERGRVEWQGQARDQSLLLELTARLNQQGRWTLVRTEQTWTGADTTRPAVRFTLHRLPGPEAAP